MKNKIILVIILIAMIFCLCGCNNKSVSKTNERFIKKELGLGDSSNCIIIDKETKVQYIFYKTYSHGYGGSGLTVLLNSDGTPLLYEGEN